jgi:hypothetical protein
VFGNRTRRPRISMNNEEIARKLAHWLSSRRHTRTVHPVIVQIGRRFYPAARYSQATQRSFQDRLYIVGEMPPLQNRLKRACYRTDHSDDGWHLLAWCRVKSSRCVELQEAQPFGSRFILLFQSALENWATEQADGKKLHRIPMTVTEVGPPTPDVNQPVKKRKDDGRR